jgi:hypothetical protein
MLPDRLRYSLHAVDHVFKKGRTLVVEGQSTWFLLYDRNPQTFVPNIMTAHPDAYRKATVTIVSDKAQSIGAHLAGSGRQIKAQMIAVSTRVRSGFNQDWRPGLL